MISALNLILNQPRDETYGSTEFDGVDDRITQNTFFGTWGDNDGFNRTWMGWFKLGTTGNNTVRTIFANWDPRKDVGGFVNRGVKCHYYKTTGGVPGLEFWIRHKGTVNTYDTQLTLAAAGIGTDEWFHLAIVYDSTGQSAFAGDVTWYINGIKKTHTTLRNTLSNTQTTSSRYGWSFGMYMTNNTTVPAQFSSPYIGKMAEFKIFEHTFLTKLMGDEVIGDHYYNGRMTHAKARHQEQNAVCVFKFNGTRGVLGAEVLATHESSRSIDTTGTGPHIMQAVGGVVIGGSNDAPGEVT